MTGMKGADYELREVRWELTDALDEMYYAVLRLDLASGMVAVLQSKDHPEWEQTQMPWQEYLDHYSKMLTKQGRAKMEQRLTCQALLAEASSGERDFAFDVSYEKNRVTNWLNISVCLRVGEESGYAYLFVRRSNEEHLFRSIIDLYVYDSFDYFLYLDARSNSYVMFSGKRTGSPLPPAVCKDYHAAIEDYAKAFVVPDDREKVLRKMQLNHVKEQLEHGKVYSFTMGVQDPARGYARKQLSYRYYDRRAQRILLSCTDVTEVYFEERARQKELQAAQRQAKTDSLTGLLNYGGIKDRLEEILTQEKERAALLFIDLDDFKKVNDSMGHQAGDRMLWKVAQVLQLQTGDQDIQGRVGGDEFLVLLRDVKDHGQVENCARRICKGISDLFLHEDSTFSISCSIGVAVSPQDGTDYPTLVRCADRRLYLAKARGKNCFFMSD